jgi:large subunit ribosomal protein L21
MKKKISNQEEKLNINIEKKEESNLSPSSLPNLERYAIIQTGGKQYFALEGKTLAIEKIDGNAGDEIIFKEVLFKRLDKDNCEIGHPFIGTYVKATIVKQMRDKKIIVFKFKKRKKCRTKKGHRQQMTIVRIISI